MPITTAELEQALLNADEKATQLEAGAAGNPARSAAAAQARAEARMIAEELYRIKNPPEMSVPEGPLREKDTLLSRAWKKGLASIAGIPGQVGDLDQMMLPDRQDGPPTTDQILERVRKGGGPDLRVTPPETGVAKLVDTAASYGTPAALLSRGSLLARGLQTAGGVAGGVTGESISNMTGSPLAGILAGILGQNTLQGFRYTKPNANRLVERDLEELAPGELQAGQAGANKLANTLDSPALLPQGFNRPTAFENTMNYLVGSEEGGRLRSTLAQQLVAAVTKANELRSRTTGQEPSWAQQARVLNVADDAIAVPEKLRARGTAALLEAAKQEQASPMLADIINEILSGKRVQKNLPLSSEGGQAITAVQRDLEGLKQEGMPTVQQSQILDANGRPIETTIPGRQLSPMDFATLKREARARTEAGFDSQKAARGDYGKAWGDEAAASTLRDTLNEFPAQKAYNAKFREMSGAVDDMKVSPLATLFTEELRAGKIGDWNKYTAVFSDAKYGPDAVKQIGMQLRNADPTGQAFALIVKQHLNTEWEAALKSATGRTPQEAAGVFAANAMGQAGSPTRAKFTAAMEEVGLARGQNPKEVAAAANDAADAFLAASRGRGGLEGIDIKRKQAEGALNIVSGVMRIPGMLVGASPMAAKLDDMVRAHTQKKVVDILMSADGVDKLAEIARYSGWANAGKVLAHQLLMQGAGAATMGTSPFPARETVQ